MVLIITENIKCDKYKSSAVYLAPGAVFRSLLFCPAQGQLLFLPGFLLDLDNSDTSDGVLVRDLGGHAVGGAEDGVDLSCGALWKLLDDVLEWNY